MRGICLSIVFVHEKDITMRNELYGSSADRKFNRLTAYRFDTLSTASAYVDAENAMTSPFALAREAFQASDVIQSRLDRSSLEMYPVERRWAIRIVHGKAW